MVKRFREHAELDTTTAKRPKRSDESSTKQPRGREEFEMTVICALTLELDAVNCLVDEFWTSDYHKVAGDPNHYTHGRIGKYNVVIVLLPDMGKVHAAGAASSLSASYTKLRLALLVGICGGVPKPNDDGDEILLGDVIISNALVQFDFGRRYPRGRFLRKNSLRDGLSRPNKYIRASLRNLEVNRYRENLEQRAAELLRELQAANSSPSRNRRQRDKYKYPGTRYDILFSAEYRHEHRGASVTCCDDSKICDAALKASCEECGCDEINLVGREQLDYKKELEGEDPTKAQEPAIYIGPVASGDTVMKSGEDRDRIAKEGVIAFEMEGAGVWDEIPCVVVKGVCDYADSHKHKQWQNFAAATAAAAMKALLETFVDTEKPKIELQGLAAAQQTVDGSNVLSFDEQALAQMCLFIQMQAQGRFGKQMPLSPVLVIDARGCNLPFYLETISSKELFTQILQDRFSDIGTKKIERSEWYLEDRSSGQRLDLSKPWQSAIKIAQPSSSNAYGIPKTEKNGVECPSCSFMNPSSSSDEIQCYKCGTSYRRVEEVQDIQINKKKNRPKVGASLDPDPTAQNNRNQSPFPRPRPARQTENEVRLYKYVQLVDVNFSIRIDGARQSDKAAFPLNLDQLHDTERLAEYLANFYGIPALDSLNVAQMASKFGLEPMERFHGSTPDHSDGETSVRRDIRAEPFGSIGLDLIIHDLDEMASHNCLFMEPVNPWHGLTPSPPAGISLSQVSDHPFLR
ncbi:hypothetical protein PT974_01121 [Cladobotryum mycophilum]|uniref:Nucleoside phosphorylase domain-containing protein n=1 Tax=Cladobotryum mycophilum TaxID=491253 RepID=A0ABR0T310_9HYPO